MRKLIVPLLLLVFLQPKCFSQVAVAPLDSLFNALNTRGLALGSVCISLNGKPIYQKALGYSLITPDNKTPTTLQTRYRIGSVSKVFTAVLIFQLVEEGKIRLDQPLSTFFPTLPNAQRITIAHLLNHASGLHDYTNNTGFENWMSNPKPQAELLQLIQDKGADFEPGTRNEYCNTNYLLLSYIVETVTRTSYEQALQQRIVSKIKLHNTYVAKYINPANQESYSYKYANGSWNPVAETHPGIHSGAGAIVSTPTELNKFFHALFTGKLVRSSSLEKMKAVTNGYGSGLFSYDHNGHAGYGHNGRIEEFYTACRYYPEHKIAVTYCTNGINYPRIDILDNLAKACFNEPVSIPFQPQAQPTSLARYSGEYAAAQMPAVTVMVKNNTLIAQTQGVDFELEPVSEHYFMHAATGYYFDFRPAENALYIKETDNVYFLEKK